MRCTTSNVRQIRSGIVFVDEIDKISGQLRRQPAAPLDFSTMPARCRRFSQSAGDRAFDRDTAACSAAFCGESPRM
jgi:hypothetical protein